MESISRDRNQAHVSFFANCLLTIVFFCRWRRGRASGNPGRTGICLRRGARGRPHPTLIEQDCTTTLYVCEPVFRLRGGWLAGTSDCESVGEASRGGCELFSPLEIGRCGSQGWAIGAVSSLVVHLHSVAARVVLDSKKNSG